MGLETYSKEHDFKKTTEPRGKVGRSGSAKTRLGAKAKPKKGIAASGKAVKAKTGKSKGSAAKREAVEVEDLFEEASTAGSAATRNAPGGRPDLNAIKGARRAPLPRSIEPQLAMLVDHAPTEPGWVYELKYDGYRVLAWLDKGRARFLTRNGKDWTEQFVALAGAVESLPAESAIFDGEVVVMRPDGTTDFQALQNALKEGSQAKLVYFIFDLLYADGVDLRGASLADRKAVLASILAGAPAGGAVRYSDHVDADGAIVHRHACRLALEGVVAKRIGAPYRAGRGHDWLKLKCQSRQEFIIGGYTDPGGARTGIGAVLVGLQEKDGSLRYCGKVGTGFTEKTLRDLSARLKAIETATTPFANPPRMPGAHWVKPKLLCEIEFTAWTNGGNLRHPSFQGLREDKAPQGIVREDPQPVGGKEAKSIQEKAAPISISTAVAARKASTAPVKSRVAPKGKAAMKGEAAKPGVRLGPVVIAGVTLSNPDKPLYPEQGITKQELALYYESVAKWMLPHVALRPLTLVRCPSGQGKPCFFQKHMGEGTPGSVKPVEIRDKGGPDNYLYIDSVEGLVALVQMGALEMHVWGSHIDAVEEPDQIVIDLDPAPELAWDAVVRGAREVRDRLLDLGLESFVKTTGGKGLHVVAPLERGHGADWDSVKAFTKGLAVMMERDSPTRYIANMSKAKRTDKIFIDYLRNGRGATAVCSFSTRSRPGATVSTPIRWEELSASLRPADFNVETVPRRLARLKKDPWDGFSSVRQFITEEMKRHVGLR